MPRPRTDFPKEMFYFWRADPGTGLLKAEDWKLQFEAHITNINDTSSPSYGEFFDMGRADPKVLYSGASRNISVSFFVVALNDREHTENHDTKLARLGRMTYPIYQQGNGYNSPHVLFQIGKLIKGYGVLTNVTYNWEPDWPWKDGRPLYTDVNLSIKMLANSIGKRPDAGSRYFI